MGRLNLKYSWFRKLVKSRPLRLSLSVVMLVLSVLMLASLLGIDSEKGSKLREARASVAQSLALQLSSIALVGYTGDIGTALEQVVDTNDDIIAAAIAQPNGYTFASIGDSNQLAQVNEKSTDTHMRVPIFKGDSHWGNVDVVFKPRQSLGAGFLWYAFVGVGSFLAVLFFFKRALVQLDPSRAVPGRVDSAFNLFNEGVIILDDNLRIVMANASAGALINKPADDLIGQTLDAWPWIKDEDWQATWATTLNSSLQIADRRMRLLRPDKSEGVYFVSSSVVGNNKDKRGVLVTLDDMTEVEDKTRELKAKEVTLLKLNDSLTAKNEELEVLATRDPLSGLFNRRVLMETLTIELNLAKKTNTPLSVVMVDIDFFKKVNDTFGHGVGDDVIRSVAGALDDLSREGDTVGRYGGEEFMLVAPGSRAEAVKEVAEVIRVAVMGLPEKENLPVSSLSASFGVAELGNDDTTEATIIDQADQALYAAKQQGRNCVQIYSKRTAASKQSDNENAKNTLAAGVATHSNTDSDNTVAGSSAEATSLAADAAFERIKQLEALVRQRTSDLNKLSQHDTLTGVPLRALFIQRADIEIKRCAALEKSVGVMSFEIRDYDRLASTFGHSAIEALVVEFVARLHAGLGETDTVADITEDHNLSRITGNEYGVLLAGMNSSDHAMPVVTRLRRLLSKPFLVNSEKVYIGANIGIATFPQSGDTGDKLLEYASTERVKASHSPDKVSHSFASDQLDTDSKTYIRVESDLYDAVHNQQLEVYYQPKFDLGRRAITGTEALVRWRNAEGGFNSPMDFIPIAEANGLINELYDFVLAEALRQLKAWAQVGFPDLTVAVNISAVQLRDSNLVAKTIDAIRKANVRPEQLEIELTETAIIDHRERANQTLYELRSHGVKVSMDDFGIGYTSLALLADLPIDTVKIDRSFIVAMDQSERSRAIIESIIMMAQALDLTVVGEGIEKNSQLETLDVLGCHLIQGYLIAKPLPKDEIVAFLIQQQKRPNSAA